MAEKAYDVNGDNCSCYCYSEQEVADEVKRLLGRGDKNVSVRQVWLDEDGCEIDSPQDDAIDDIVRDTAVLNEVQDLHPATREDIAARIECVKQSLLSQGVDVDAILRKAGLKL